MNKQRGESGLAQRLWTRYTRFSAAAPHTRLARRIYQTHRGQQPLLQALQRRWLPGGATPVGAARATLPYAPPFVAAYTQTLASGGVASSVTSPLMVQRRAVAIPVASQPLAPQPDVIAQRSRLVAGAQPTAHQVNPARIGGESARRGAVAPALPSQVQRQVAQPVASAPVVVGRLVASTRAATPPLSLIQRAAIPSLGSSKQPGPDASAVRLDHSAATPGADGIPPPVVSGRSITGARGEAASITIVKSAPVSMVHRTIQLPGQTFEPAPRPGALQTSPTIQRQAEGRNRQPIPVVESARPITTGRPEIAMHSSGMVQRAPDRAASPSSFPDLTGKPLGPTASPLGLAIVQRYLSTAQPGAHPEMGGQPHAHALGRTGSRQQALTGAGVVQRLPAPLPTTPGVGLALQRSTPVLPLARQVVSPLASGLATQPSAPFIANGHAALPLAGLATRGPTALQRQPEQSGMNPLAPSAATAPATNATASSTPSTASSTTGDQANPNAADELADQVWRKLLRRLAVEGERRGGHAWP